MKARWCGVVLGLMLTANALAQAPLWVRVSTESLPGALAHKAMVYGDDAYLLLDPADLAALPAEVNVISARTDAFELRLPHYQGDPLLDPPVGSALVTADAGFVLVQLKGPTRPEWLSLLREAGAEIVDFIAPFSYLVWAPAPTRAQLKSLPFVRWEGALNAAMRQTENFSAPLVSPIRLVAWRGQSPSTIALDQVGAKVLGRAAIDSNYEVIIVDARGSHAAALLALPGVLKLESIPTDGGSRGELASQINVMGFNASGVPIPGYRAWLAARNLSGAGVRIANVDGGVDQNHPTLAGRVMSCTGSTCSSASSSHGTHTAGIMAGNGGGDVRDSGGFLRGLGVAPGASLIEQVYGGFFNQPGGMLLLMTQSQRNGAVVSGNSWGPAGTPRGYDSDTRQVDVGSRDADPDLAGNQPLIYVLSIMNGNGGLSSQGTPDEAKNVFAIGSTRAQLSSLAPESDLQSLSANSAHGPALDGRILPHMVAPGCRVDSSTPNSSYGALCGTSMASPQVSGAVALLVEKQRRERQTTPSPAMVKAMFTAVARDLKGNRDASGTVLPTRNTPRQGWGRMDLAAVIDAPRGSVVQVDQTTVLGASGEAFALSAQVLDASQPVRVMLAWTDAPGNPLGGNTPAWNNDLDLEVRVRRASYWGNALNADGFSIDSGTPETRNNLEGAMFRPGQLSGSFELLVRASNIASDGVPGNADSTDQDFALVCYNCVIPGVSDLIFKDSL